MLAARACPFAIIASRATRHGFSTACQIALINKGCQVINDRSNRPTRFGVLLANVIQILCLLLQEGMKEEGET